MGDEVRAGRGEVAKRFNHLARSDWGALVDLWEVDKRLAEEEEMQRNRRQQPNAGEELEKKRKVSLKLLSEGMISKAVNRIRSHGIANMSEQGVKAKDKVPW